jgi:hypothetical protein
MKSHLLKLVALTAIWAVPQLASAGSWIFRPSYYSHEPTTNVRIGRQYSKGPVFTRPEGSYVRGGWRWQNAPLIVGGQIYDNYNYYESWVQHGEQY